jgi:hypothetical protein
LSWIHHQDTIAGYKLGGEQIPGQPDLIFCQRGLANEPNPPRMDGLSRSQRL